MNREPSITRKAIGWWQRQGWIGCGPTAGAAGPRQGTGGEPGRRPVAPGCRTPGENAVEDDGSPSSAAQGGTAVQYGKRHAADGHQRPRNEPGQDRDRHPFRLTGDRTAPAPTFQDTRSERAAVQRVGRSGCDGPEGLVVGVVGPMPCRAAGIGQTEKSAFSAGELRRSGDQNLPEMLFLASVGEPYECLPFCPDTLPGLLFFRRRLVCPRYCQKPGHEAESKVSVGKNSPWIVAGIFPVIRLTVESLWAGSVERVTFVAHVQLAGPDQADWFRGHGNFARGRIRERFGAEAFQTAGFTHRFPIRAYGLRRGRCREVQRLQDAVRRPVLVPEGVGDLFTIWRFFH